MKEVVTVITTSGLLNYIIANKQVMQFQIGVSLLTECTRNQVICVDKTSDCGAHSMYK